MRRTRLLWAAGPATLGVLAAHQFAYVGHDDGHLHGYLAELGPWLAAASTVASILVWRMPRVRFSDVVALQVLLLATMEIGERLVTSTPWAWADFATVGVALVSVLVLSTLVLGIARITSLPIRVGYVFGLATCPAGDLPVVAEVPGVFSPSSNRGPPVPAR